MPQFTTEIIYDSADRTVQKFIFSDSAVAPYQLTGGLNGYAISGWRGATGENVDFSVSKIFWTQTGATSNLQLSWAQIGSITGQPFLNLSQSGYVNLSADALSIPNTTTGHTRNNGILIRNTNHIASTDALSVIIEIVKTKGYGLTG